MCYTVGGRTHGGGGGGGLVMGSDVRWITKESQIVIYSHFLKEDS